MAVGPIMMFKPNSHTRRLEALRAEAAQQGIKLRTVNYESRNQQHSVVVYCLPCKTAFNSAILERRDFAHDIHFHKHWDWQEGKKADLSQSQTKALIDFADQLPNTVVGLEFSAGTVGLWWQEKHLKQWGVNELKAALIRLKSIVGENTIG